MRLKDNPRLCPVFRKGFPKRHTHTRKRPVEYSFPVPKQTRIRNKCEDDKTFLPLKQERAPFGTRFTIPVTGLF